MSTDGAGEAFRELEDAVFDPLAPIFEVIRYSCEQVFKVIRRAFLMDQRGEWMLSLAFEVRHAYNPDGDETAGQSEPLVKACIALVISE